MACKLNLFEFYWKTKEADKGTQVSPSPTCGVVNIIMEFKLYIYHSRNDRSIWAAASNNYYSVHSLFSHKLKEKLKEYLNKVLEITFCKWYSKYF